jgi:hypothetical protein
MHKTHYNCHIYHNALHRFDKGFFVGFVFHRGIILIGNALQDVELTLQKPPRIVQRVEGVVVFPRLDKFGIDLLVQLHQHASVLSQLGMSRHFVNLTLQQQHRSVISGRNRL